VAEVLFREASLQLLVSMPLLFASALLMPTSLALLVALPLLLLVWCSYCRCRLSLSTKNPTFATSD
jgi:hypothetical protein